MKSKKISKLVVQRLELYLKYLKTLPDSVTNISATAIAKALDLGEVQVRKDLARVSCGGRRRTGHMRDRLIRDIENFLFFGFTTNAIVIGAGKLGQALLAYDGFVNADINLMAGFDLKAEPTCTENGKPIFPVAQLESFCKNNNVQIGIITVPEDSAQQVCDCLVTCGVQAIWNFAPIHLNAPDHIVVQNENLAVSVTALRLQLQ